MPPARRTPAADPEGAPSPEELEGAHDEAADLADHLDDPAANPGAADMAQSPETLIYEGDILTSGMTLAVLLPGDNRESYFPVKFTARRQPDETGEDLATRVITVVRETAIGQIDDAIDALAEYHQELAKSGRLGRG